MKKLLVPTLCVLAGCAAGAMIPAVTAQWPENPQAQRWQQECVLHERTAMGVIRMDVMQSRLRERGAQGWEAFAVDVDFMCFKRPAP